MVFFGLFSESDTLGDFCTSMCLRQGVLLSFPFKKKIGKPGKADRLFRLMDINGVCHIVFCGRLEPRFLGQTVVSLSLIHIWKPFSDPAPGSAGRLFGNGSFTVPVNEFLCSRCAPVR